MRYIHMLNKSIFAIFGLRKKDKIKNKSGFKIEAVGHE